MLLLMALQVLLFLLLQLGSCSPAVLLHFALQLCHPLLSGRPPRLLHPEVPLQPCHLPLQGTQCSTRRAQLLLCLQQLVLPLLALILRAGGCAGR